MTDHAERLAAALRALLAAPTYTNAANARQALTLYDAERRRMWPSSLNLPATDTGD